MKLKISILTLSFFITFSGLSNDDDKVKSEYRDTLAGVNSTTDSRTEKKKEKNVNEKDELYDFNYWITKSSGKRHNKSCRYYKSSNGYGTNNSSEGKICGVCGS